MKPALVWLLIFSLAFPAFGKELTPAEQAAKIKLGAKIEVTLQSKEVIKGRRGPLTSTGFSVEPMKNGAGTARALELRDIKSVRQTGLNTAEKALIITGAAIGVLALTIYIWAKASGC